MTRKLTEYRVFIASPSGLDKERKAFCRVVNIYSDLDATPRGVVFKPFGWESVHGGAGRPQALINEELQKCDYFVLLLWDRWGTPTEAIDNPRFSSGCEEEFYFAEKCLLDRNSPMRQVVIYFKGIEPRQFSDPGPQLEKVLNFRKKLELEKRYMFKTFDELASLEHELRSQLSRWLRDHEEGVEPEIPEIKPVLKDVTHKRSLSSSKDTWNSLLNEAEKFVKLGRLTDAEAIFTHVIVNGNDPAAFIRYGRFLQRIGRLEQAKVMYNHILSIAQSESSTRLRATAYGNLGLICQTQGDFPQAEKMHRMALTINEELKNGKGDAIAYTSLGLICSSKGDLSQAEEFHKRALEINKNLNLDEGIAIALSNLGVIYKDKGELDQAEAMFKKALKINKRISRQECIAKDYRNLGVVYHLCDDLGISEKMLQKALVINQRLGRQKGMADTYSDLGIVFQKRGALAVAEDMYYKSLKINDALGRREKMANDYMNLGVIAQNKGDTGHAMELWQRSRNYYTEIGASHMIDSVQTLLNKLADSA